MPAEKFDKRLIDRKVRKGDLSREDLQGHLKGLPDLANNVAVLETKLEAVAQDGAEDGKESEDE